MRFASHDRPSEKLESFGVCGNWDVRSVSTDFDLDLAANGMQRTSLNPNSLKDIYLRPRLSILACLPSWYFGRLKVWLFFREPQA